MALPLAPFVAEGEGLDLAFLVGCGVRHQPGGAAAVVGRRRGAGAGQVQGLAERLPAAPLEPHRLQAIGAAGLQRQHRPRADRAAEAASRLLRVGVGAHAAARGTFGTAAHGAFGTRAVERDDPGAGPAAASGHRDQHAPGLGVHADDGQRGGRIADGAVGGGRLGHRRQRRGRRGGDRDSGGESGHGGNLTAVGGAGVRRRRAAMFHDPFPPEAAVRTMRAGTPAAVAPAGTSATTTAPAAMVASSPTLTPPSTSAPALMVTRSPTRG